MDPRAEYLAKILDLNRRLVLRCLEKVSEEHFVATAPAGGNSIQWILGHLTGSRLLMARMLGADAEYPYREQFKRGGLPGDPAALPGPAELTSRWIAACDLVGERLAAADAEAFGRPAATDGPPSADGTVLGCIAFMTMHDSYHLGQLGSLRKVYGYQTLAG